MVRHGFAGDFCFDPPAVVNQLFMDHAANGFHESRNPVYRANRASVDRGGVDSVLLDSNHADPAQRDAAGRCTRARTTRTPSLVQNHFVSGRGRDSFVCSQLADRFHRGSISQIFGAEPVFCRFVCPWQGVSGCVVPGRLGLPLPGVAVGAQGDTILVSPDCSPATSAEIWVNLWFSPALRLSILWP